jgi:hypothetical protein
MGQTGTKIITFMLYKNLGFMFQTAKRAGMDNSISITLKARPKIAFVFGKQPASSDLWT